MAISDKIRTKTGSGNGRADLLCPRCGSDYLHHNDVLVFDRREDAEAVTLTQVDAGSVSVSMAPSTAAGNPSMRRDGVTINFWCENCGENRPLQLHLAQHKGCTEIFWEFDN